MPIRSRSFCHINLCFTLLLTAFLSLPAHSDTNPGGQPLPAVPSNNWRFSATEQQVLRLALDSTTPPPQIWQQLENIAAATPQTDTANQAWILLQQCRLAKFIDGADRSKILQQMSVLQSNQLPSAAWYKCQQYQAIAQQQDEKEFEYGYQAYLHLTDKDVSALRMWLAYDVANIALDAGYTDEAMVAARLSLEIARQNELPGWQGETLGIIARIQAALGLFDDAIATNQSALDLADTEAARYELQLNRGYIQTQAKRYDAALAWQLPMMAAAEQNDPETYLMVGGNVAKIYLEQDKITENLQLTAKLLAVADRTNNDYLWAYTAMARAFGLLEHGDTEQSRPLFAKARRWFEQNNAWQHLSENLQHWSTRLSKNGLHAEAYQALVESNALKQRYEAARRSKDALLKNAQLETERQRNALLQLQQHHDQDQALLVQTQLENRLWFVVFTAIVLLISVLTYAYYRLRQAHVLLTLKNQQLDYESSHDPLTKVFNRRYFQQFITPKIASHSEALLLLMDIDHFKKVNDTYGHHAGDQVLEIVSQRLASRLRDCDCIVRWGGEEFLLYIDKPVDLQNCRALVQRLLSEIEQTPFQLDDGQLTVTISIGFSFIRLQSQEALEQQLGAIDSFLYQAKKQGRNRAIGLLTDTAEAAEEIIAAPLAVKAP